MKPEDVFAELGKALAGKLVKDSVTAPNRNVQSLFKCCIQRVVKRSCNITTFLLLSHYHMDSRKEKLETEQKTAEKIQVNHGHCVGLTSLRLLSYLTVPNCWISECISC